MLQRHTQTGHSTEVKMRAYPRKVEVKNEINTRNTHNPYSEPERRAEICESSFNCNRP